MTNISKEEKCRERKKEKITEEQKTIIDKNNENKSD